MPPLLKRSISLWAAVAACTLFPLIYAQEQPSYSVEVDIVPIIATVRNDDGQLVADLSREDFVLEEEGRRQEIEYFAREADLPLTIGLLVDSSMSQRRILQEEREASYQFLQQVLRPEKDLVFVISFDVDVELLQDLTNDLTPLQASLEEVQVPSGGDRGQRIGTVLYDSVFLSSDEIMQEQSGRKALILLSDGVEVRSLVDSNAAIEAAQRSDTVIYGIRYYDEDSYSGGGWGGMSRGGGQGRSGRFPGPGPGGTRGGRPPDGKEVLEELSEETGGRLFEVSKKLSLSQIFEEIEEELRSQYILGYTPKEAESNGDYRRITVKTRNKKLKVQSRAGYYPNR